MSAEEHGGQHQASAKDNRDQHVFGGGHRGNWGKSTGPSGGNSEKIALWQVIAESNPHNPNNPHKPAGQFPAKSTGIAEFLPKIPRPRPPRAGRGSPPVAPPSCPIKSELVLNFSETAKSFCHAKLGNPEGTEMGVGTARLLDNWGSQFKMPNHPETQLLGANQGLAPTDCVPVVISRVPFPTGILSRLEPRVIYLKVTHRDSLP
jgi:hypothetical protein